ncbi:MAG TPA: TonB family protein [Ignavibacteriales bacterium]|nr:TonB family protein [Ignavibacteriales bacterium]HEX3072588.1 TonB family protein [Ignavibacteriales bacterium]
MIRFCFLLLASILFYSSVFAQDGLIVSYYGNGNIRSEESYIKDIKDGPAYFYYENGNLQSQLEYNQGMLFGLCREYYENGALKAEIMVKEGKRDGIVKFYYDNGGLQSLLHYENGVLIKESYFEKDPYLTYTPPAVKPKTLTDMNRKKVYKLVKRKKTEEPAPVMSPSKSMENEPEFYLGALDTAARPIGGLEAIQRNLKYPELAERANVMGEVSVRLYINEYGSIDNAEIIKGIGMGCDEAALEAIKKATFLPGRFLGRNVKSQIVIPVEFKKEIE